MKHKGKIWDNFYRDNSNLKNVETKCKKCEYVLQGIGYLMLHHLRKKHANDQNDSDVEEVLG